MSWSALVSLLPVLEVDVLAVLRALMFLASVLPQRLPPAGPLPSCMGVQCAIRVLDAYSATVGGLGWPKLR